MVPDPKDQVGRVEQCLHHDPSGPPSAYPLAVRIRDATPEDWPAIYPTFSAITKAGRAYAYPEDATSDEARDLWMGQGRVVVAVDDGQVRGTSRRRRRVAAWGVYSASTEPGYRWNSNSRAGKGSLTGAGPSRLTPTP
jgi:hypothetical protein